MIHPTGSYLGPPRRWWLITPKTARVNMGPPADGSRQGTAPPNARPSSAPCRGNRCFRPSPPHPCPMNARLDLVLDEARAALSAPDQERLADLIAAYVASHAAPPDLTAEELAEPKRPARRAVRPGARARGEGVLRPPPWLTSASRGRPSSTSPPSTPGSSSATRPPPAASSRSSARLGGSRCRPSGGMLDL